MKLRFVILWVVVLISVRNSYSQCLLFPATVPASNCDLYTPLSNNTSANSGETYGICREDDAIYNFSGLNLNGGTIRVCANASFSGNWNSGTIVVECGSTLYFPSGLLLNNGVKIVNYGTVHVTGTLNFQNNNNCFYNESDSSRLFVAGDIRTPQNNNQTAFIKNNGYISVTGSFSCINGCYMCLGENSQIVTDRFRYMQNCSNPVNRIERPNNNGTAVIRYASEIILNSIPTFNPTVQFWRQTGATNNVNFCTSFGSATVVNNAPEIPTRPAPLLSSCAVLNCRTTPITLPVELSYFDAAFDEQTSFVDVSWETVTEQSSDYFEVMRSHDGYTWDPIGYVKAAGHSTKLQKYSFTDRYPHQGISYYRLDQYDFDGQVNSSGIRSVSSNRVESLTVYPNPATHIINVSSQKETNGVYVYSLTGELLISIDGNSPFKHVEIDISKLAVGIYYLKTDSESTLIHKTN